MGQIQKIAIKNDYVFAGNGIEIDDCNVVNFIYGPNGSGKSTISGVLRNSPTSESVSWKGTPCAVHVYNRDWRESNFHDRADLPGVFTLGSDSIQARKRVDDLKSDLEKCSKKIEKATTGKSDKEAELSAARSEFEANAWTNILKVHEDNLAPALSGYRRSRAKFAQRLLDQEDSTPEYDLEELTRRVKEIFSNQPEEYCLIETETFHQYRATVSEFEACNLWQKVITGNQDVDVAKLIEKLGNGDWVRAGRAYIEDSNICPFCQQETITQDFKNQIEKFFDEEYKANIENIKHWRQLFQETCEQYLELASNALSILGKAQIDGINLAEIEETIHDIECFRNSTVALLKSKIDEPGRKISIPKFEILHERFLQQINLANAAIEAHNQIIKNIKKEKGRLENQAWAFLRKTAEALIRSYQEQEKRISKAIKGLQKTIDEQNENKILIEANLISARKDITSVQSSVDEINRLLRAYGFDGFKVCTSESDSDCYEIVRPDGTPVNRTLSEGEETFIAFLYFIQTIDGSTSPDELTSDRVIVIDDPICSLDSTILYIVSSMVKELIARAKSEEDPIQQIFILTHNVFFHKEASFTAGKPNEDKKVSYWTLSKNGTTSTIKSHGHTNTIKTAYELLWQELKDENANVVTLQNTMRRIIENYFGMLGKNKPSSIENSFETYEEKIICRSLFAWMNDGSHSIPDDLYIDSYSESPNKYKEVFKAIFVNTGNEEHYNMMMGCSSLL